MLCKTINNQSHKTIRVTNIRITNNHSHKTISLTNKVSKDHQSNKQLALQDHQHTTKNNTLQDHQPRHRHRKVPSNRSTSMTEIQSSTVDQLLQCLIAVNGHGNIQTPKASSETPSIPRSKSTLTTSTYNSEDDTSSSDDESIVSTMSDRQLRPQVPISYHETVLKKLHGQPQVKTCNNLSIPLPTDSSEEDTDSESKETEEEANMYSK